MVNSNSTDEDDIFCNASDEFPFYDSLETFDLSDDSSSPSNSTISLPPSQNSDSVHFPVSGGLRRRRSVVMRERNRKLYLDRVETMSDSGANSVITELNDKNEEDSPPVRENDDEEFSFLVYLAELVVKAIGLQFNLLITFITFPFWVLYYSCLFAVNPFHVVGLGRDYFMGHIMWLWSVVVNAVTPFVSDWLKEHKSSLKLVLRCGWGIFWSIFVCSVLVTMLMSAFVMSGLMMRYYLVDQPFQLKQTLNFDYTKSKPVAFVPISACPTKECGATFQVEKGRSVRVIPPNHKLQATISLIMPESDYNRNLGNFQVRMDFLSDDCRVLASLSHPCMLKFKSGPIRLLSTSVKVIPLLAGYLSESQTLNLKLSGYKEGITPTACLRVTIEQRAEFRYGAGIPEVYDAFVHIESKLPFFKRLFWYWRKTIFVWLGMMLFVVELFFALLCCRPLIFPRARTRANAPRSGPQTSHQVQR